MELIETKIGEYDLLTETKNDDKIKILNEERDTVKTGIQFKNTENKLIDNAKCIVSKIASEFGNELMYIDPHPKEVEVEFEVLLSNETNLWILTAGGSSNIKAMIKWENKT